MKTKYDHVWFQKQDDRNYEVYDNNSLKRGSVLWSIGHQDWAFETVIGRAVPLFILADIQHFMEQLTK